MPAAVGVVLDAGNDAGLDGVLMDVIESGGQELLYKSLETIYSLKNRYLSVA